MIMNMGLTPSSKARNVPVALSACDAAIEARTAISARWRCAGPGKSRTKALESSSSSGVMSMALAIVAPIPLVVVMVVWMCKWVSGWAGRIEMGRSQYGSTP